MSIQNLIDLVFKLLSIADRGSSSLKRAFWRVELRCPAVTGRCALAPSITDSIDSSVERSVGPSFGDGFNGSANLKPSMASTGMFVAAALPSLDARGNSAITAAFAAAAATATPFACTRATSPEAAAATPPA